VTEIDSAQGGPLTEAHLRRHKGITRKGVFRRAGAAVGGLLASRLLPGSLGTATSAEYPTSGFNTCDAVRYYTICTTGATSTCSVGYGFPSCSDSYVTRYSPNQRYELTCHCICPEDCRCEPVTFSARVAVKNDGTCGCTCVL
jgi:hypothetical protein